MELRVQINDFEDYDYLVEMSNYDQEFALYNKNMNTFYEQDETYQTVEPPILPEVPEPPIYYADAFIKDKDIIGYIVMQDDMEIVIHLSNKMNSVVIKYDDKIIDKLKEILK